MKSLTDRNLREYGRSLGGNSKLLAEIADTELPEAAIYDMALEIVRNHGLLPELLEECKKHKKWLEENRE